MLKKILFASLTAFCAVTSGAQARINGPHPRECVMAIGPAQIMFSAFQENKTDETFCAHVPETGPTMLILDAKQEELRGMNIEVRVLRNIGQQDWRDDLDATTVAVLPMKKYLADKGTATFMHTFAEDGNYITLVRATSDDGAKEYVGQYYFSVGDSAMWAVATGAITLTLGFVALGLWQHNSRKTGKKTVPPKPAASAARQST